MMQRATELTEYQDHILNIDHDIAPLWGRLRAPHHRFSGSMSSDHAWVRIALWAEAAVLDEPFRMAWFSVWSTTAAN